MKTKYTKENIVEGIHTKLDEIYGGDPMYRGLLHVYKQELINYPKEIEQNVLEWVNGDEISEVDCHGVSILGVMKFRNVSVKSVPHIILNFIDFERDGFRDQSICYDIMVSYD